MISEKFIFVHIPRTGGTSLERLLLTIEGIASWEDLENKNLVDSCLGKIKHMRASNIRSTVGEKKWRGTLKFSIVRNPFDKVISHFYQPYYRKINALSGASLEDFLLAYRPAPHEDGLTCSDYLDEDLDQIIRYENYNEDVFRLLRDFDIQYSQIDTRIGYTRPEAHYREHYDSNTRSMVERIYADDLMRFDYHF